MTWGGHVGCRGALLVGGRDVGWGALLARGQWQIYSKEDWGSQAVIRIVHGKALLDHTNSSLSQVHVTRYMTVVFFGCFEH